MSDERTVRLYQRLDDYAWGLFLIMIGVLWLLPGDVPEGTWLVGAGAILLGLNVARHINGLKMSGFTIALGTAALVAGVAEWMKIDVPVFALLVILIGLAVMLRHGRPHDKAAYS